ncbi:type II toxin-antitoxin system RelE/ParE family toxin [Cylindrospermum stagnale]|uniref:type II toxin-antitoxin system RelE/ParE family toxin n=1 Tax=Cylindrospermum stagnale TaxID=142864 RepID=UPI001FE04778|nr:type II toxin-antitoxin system RelE/ParE family toxin [Cylindrospermum stagnale]
MKRYLTNNGISPFYNWFDSLQDRKVKAKIRARLDRVEEVNLGDYKSLGSGVYELRIDYGSGYRIYFSQKGLTIIILLCGGDKSTQEKDLENPARGKIQYLHWRGEN